MNRPKQLIVILLSIISSSLYAQQEKDSITTNQDAIYNRPFITIGKTRTAVGGYLEGNTNYFVEDGVTEGISLEMRRFNIFMYAQLHSRIRFLSELEFEHGTEEIALETALLDFELNPALNFRAGIILPAIGLVNTNHDSPNWEFIDRPLSSTELIPTTLSEVGFGFHGKFFPSEKVILSYDAYLTNGLQNDIILNDQGRTYIPAGKDPSFFGEDNNGTPMMNGRFSYAHRKYGEFGLAWYGGIYNTFKEEGVTTEPKRMLSILAADFQSNIQKLTVQGEFAVATVQVPEDIREIYGQGQYAGFVDLIYPVVQRKMLGFEDAVINASVRLETVDFHTGSFSTNINQAVGDENTGVAAGISFRPRSGTVLRLNYRYHWIQDNLGNPKVKRAGIQAGVASYF